MFRSLPRRILRRLPFAASLALGLLLASCSSAQPLTPSRSVVRAQPVTIPGYQPTSYLAAGETSAAEYQPAIYHPDDGYQVDVALASTRGPNIRARSWLLIDAHTGRHLASRNAETPQGVASTQKLVTALVVLDAGNLDKKVRVLASDVHVEPTCLGLRPGEVYTRRELLYAFLVKSCNDVANVLARDNAGSISAFAAKMNAKARSLGCTSSNFKNPHGLTASGQYSTARDMARIAMAAYRNGTIRDAVRRKYYTFHRSSGSTVTLKSTNELLGRMPECNGMKTGYTVASGRCLVSTASRSGRDVILVQLGTRTKYIWDDGKLLMTWGLQKASRSGSVAMR
ncbi:MAG: D-alanyl-D-alanine carboxypeptidase family protein [Prosthecobacter sp.]|nr:D-alanyl-D-alanine carboxypeptidase family protein [Prosthecobacter sp.]